jgi:hypothetical protein
VKKFGCEPYFGAREKVRCLHVQISVIFVVKRFYANRTFLHFYGSRTFSRIRFAPELFHYEPDEKFERVNAPLL